MNFLKPSNWVDPNDSEIETVTNLLHKIPQGQFQIVVRDETGQALVIENAPFFYDGTPMPTRFWLLESELFNKVSKLESAGAIKQVQEEINIEEITNIHKRYEQARDLLIDPAYLGPRPSGGVGGTRKGVKCLHAHVANLLASGDDVVGEWTLSLIQKSEAIKDLI